MIWLGCGSVGGEEGGVGGGREGEGGGLRVFLGFPLAKGGRGRQREAEGGRGRQREEVKVCGLNELVDVEYLLSVG